MPKIDRSGISVIGHFDDLSLVWELHRVHRNPRFEFCQNRYAGSPFSKIAHFGGFQPRYGPTGGAEAKSAGVSLVGPKWTLLT